MSATLDTNELLFEARARFPFLDWHVLQPKCASRPEAIMATYDDYIFDLITNQMVFEVTMGTGKERVVHPLDLVQERLEGTASRVFPPTNPARQAWLRHKEAMREQAELESLITPTKNNNKRSNSL